MTEPLRYATGRDLLAAVKARAADQARRQGVPIQQVIRQFVYDDSSLASSTTPARPGS